ncbi:hypothetical protein Hanom_Chr10g00961451 [Helianthus anomalus]
MKNKKSDKINHNRYATQKGPLFLDAKKQPFKHRVQVPKHKNLKKNHGCRTR